MLIRESNGGGCDVVLFLEHLSSLQGHFKCVFISVRYVFLLALFSISLAPLTSQLDLFPLQIFLLIFAPTHTVMSLCSFLFAFCAHYRRSTSLEQTLLRV